MYPSVPATQPIKEEDKDFSSTKDRSQSQTSANTKGSIYGVHPVIPTITHTSFFRYFSSTETLPVQKIISYYKTTLCPQMGNCHKGKDCFYYHSPEDRRRPPFFGDFLAYSSQYCPTGISCINGDNCYYSHNEFEFEFHPQQYKTNACTEDCKQVYCSFAHSPNELRKQENLVLYSVIDAHTSFPNMIQVNYNPFDIKDIPKQLLLDINKFKSKPCPYVEVHNQKQCIYFHTGSDRRRVPVFYSYERCPLSKHSHCPLEDSCSKSHNAVEQLYHPEKYKKKMCHEYPNRISECDYGEFCSFAHSEAELKIELIHEYEMDQNLYIHHFKTESCPFNHEHNKSICVYWHNWQDFRRKVEMPYPQYSPTLCPNWDTNKFINKYTEGCPRGFKCQYSHGWKECLYHPYFYKTTPCQDITKCHQGPDCPYYHGEFDRRYPTTALSSRPVPKKKQWISEQSIERISEVGTRFSEEMIHSKSNLKEEYRIEKRKQSSLSLEGISKQLSAKSSSPAKTEDQTPISGKPSLTSSIPLEEFASLKVSPEKEDTPGQKETPLEENKLLSHDEKGGEGKKDESGSKSCPSSPGFPRKRYGKMRALRDLHLDEEEEDTENLGKMRLRNLMNSIGLGELTDKLLNTGYIYYDLLVEPESKCRSAGIVDNNYIKKIVNKVHQILSRPIGSESPRNILHDR